jgi:hypothetical protein
MYVGRILFLYVYFVCAWMPDANFNQPDANFIQSAASRMQIASG